MSSLSQPIVVQCRIDMLVASSNLEFQISHRVFRVSVMNRERFERSLAVVSVACPMPVLMTGAGPKRDW